MFRHGCDGEGFAQALACGAQLLNGTLAIAVVRKSSPRHPRYPDWKVPALAGPCWFCARKVDSLQIGGSVTDELLALRDRGDRQGD